MPTMKIRGGDLDLVEYEFNSFPPGKNLKTLGYEKKKYLLKPFDGKISVKAPARILTPNLNQTTKKAKPNRPNTIDGTPARLLMPKRMKRINLPGRAYS